jgi:hypothetical protein
LSPYCRLDQQASRQGENSLNFYAVCLIFIDTHRRFQWASQTSIQ